MKVCCRPMNIKRLLVPKKLWLFASVGWTLLVFLLCLVSFNDLPSINVKSADKYVHFLFHFVFTILWFGYLRQVSNLSHFKLLFRIVFFSIFCGVVIEIAQRFFTNTRSADRYDVLANFAGALFAAILVGLIAHSKTKNNKL